MNVSSASARILVVDDDPALRRAVTRALELEGFAVDGAADGLEAVACFEDEERRRPELVVLDLLMPNLDGLAACRRIRAKSDVPILMLTARSAVEERVEGLESGADDYLVKPFAVVELHRARASAPSPFRLRRGRAALCRPRARPGGAAGETGRPAARVDPDRVRAARTLDVASPSSLVARDDLQQRLGLRHELRLQLARGLHRLSAPEDRTGRRVPPDPDGARRWLRPPQKRRRRDSR